MFSSSEVSMEYICEVEPRDFHAKTNGTLFSMETILSLFRFFCNIFNTHFHYLIFNFGSFLPKDARVNLVDLVKSFQTSISLQKSASIQPRTSPLKFGKNINVNKFKKCKNADVRRRRPRRRLDRSAIRCCCPQQRWARRRPRRAAPPPRRRSRCPRQRGPLGSAFSPKLGETGI